MIDLVVPTILGREASLKRCVDSYVELASSEVNPIIIEQSKSCGWGWAQGIEQAEAEYVLLACDDQQALRPGWDQAALECAERGYIVCPRVWTPQGTLESAGGDMNELFHLVRRPRKDWSDCDYTTVPFLSRANLEQIGMLDDAHYCTDVWVSYRGRQLGIETKLRHGFEIGHHQEQVGRGAGMEQGERDQADQKLLEAALQKAKPTEAVI